MHYGTILVDLERRRPIDLLPDRQPETVTCWLRQHPGIEVITRDRSQDYARAATAGAPQALQVADRWHLLKNLTDALRKALDKYAKQLRQWAVDGQQMGQIETVDSLALSASNREAQQLHHAARQDRFEQAHHLHRLGWQQNEIARHLGICPRTVRRYLAKDSLPQAHRYRISRLDPYKVYLLRRWNEGCHNARQLTDEIQLQGYSGGKTMVRDYVAGMRRTQADLVCRSEPSFPGGINARPLTPHRAVFLLLRPLDDTDKTRQTLFLQQFFSRLPELRSVVEPFQVFAAIVRERRAGDFADWVQTAAQSDCASLRQFARGLQQDEEAVRAALKHEWNNELTAYCTSFAL